MNKPNINIKPCSVHWNAMDENEKGKACSFCSNNVIDFTNHSNQEILDTIKSNSNVCGRVKSTQLNSIDSNFIKPKFIHSNLWKRASIFLLAFLGFKGFGDKIFAQTTTINTNDVSSSKVNLREYTISGKISKMPYEGCNASLIIDHQLIGNILIHRDKNFKFNFHADTLPINSITIVLTSKDQTGTIKVPKSAIGRNSSFNPNWELQTVNVIGERIIEVDGMMTVGVPMEIIEPIEHKVVRVINHNIIEPKWEYRKLKDLEENKNELGIPLFHNE